ncbi:MAG TPA: hypothetical protein VFS00_16790 [Polyangiaceae bacterium]|nr:hypothetical protein [Polyangiaceae bacterium]
MNPSYRSARLALATPLGLLALLTTAGPAFASSDYSARITANYGFGAGDTPSCTVCHELVDDDAGTVTKRFGLTMRNDHGLTGLSPDLEALPDQNEADGRDGDGTADVAELRAGTDPSSGGANAPEAPHGCDAMQSTIASGPPASSRLASALGAGLAATLLLQRRRARGASVRR